jgi:hypothetical protein
MFLESFWNNPESQSSLSTRDLENGVSRFQKSFNSLEAQKLTQKQNLMKEALREQLKQNPNKLKLLLSTWNATLSHTLKENSKTIPWETFSRFLMELRVEFTKL